jgi:DNA-binding Xre family transcriptional regulator
MRFMADRNAPPVYTSRGPVEGEDWPAVAAALNERMAERRIGQQELSHMCGVSVSTLRQLQHGVGRRVQNKTLIAISRALEWPDNHLNSVLLTATRPAPAQTSSGDGQVLAVLLRLEQHLHEISQRLDGIEKQIGSENAE